MIVGIQRSRMIAAPGSADLQIGHVRSREW
jgi:hypothetical protein